MIFHTTLPLTILMITEKAVCAHVATTRLLRHHELPSLLHAGRQWVPFTMQLWDDPTAIFHGRQAGYIVEYRPLREIVDVCL